MIVTQGRLGRLLDVLVERTRMRRDSVAYLCMPLFHGNAVMLNLGTAMRVGATVGLIRKFSASKFSDDIHRYGATFVNYVGRALSYVLNKPEDPRDRTGTLEVAFGTEASEVDIARFTERFGCVVIEGYGSSEGVIRINRTPECPTGSLGVVSGDVDVRIMNEETDEECPPARFDETGRLLNSEAVGRSSRSAVPQRSRATTRIRGPRPNGSRATISGPVISRTATPTGSSTSPVARRIGCVWTAKTSRPRARADPVAGQRDSFGTCLRGAGPRNG